MKNFMGKFLCAIFFNLALFAVISCSKTETGELESDGTNNTVRAVRVEPLVKSDLRKFIEVNGNVCAEKSMSIYPVMQGKIAGTRVHLGSYVRKGEVIAYVDPSVPGLRYALNEVISPISGTVISIPLKEGSRVDTETSVVTIGDLSKLQIITYIPERYVSFLKKGLEADVVLEAYPDEKFSAIVSELSPVLDEATRTKEVILTFAKNDNRINAGMFAAVNLYLRDFNDALSVPSSCIIEKEGKKFVYLIDDPSQNVVSLSEIKTGEEISDRTIIELVSDENASPDEMKDVKVVVQGFESLQDGCSVNIAE